MPLEIQDPNAQRASNTGVPGLQAQGQAVNQTAASLGQQDVTSATRTAQALGTLAQDLVGNAQQMQQKEAYVEAYANAGAGRSVAEIRAGEAPWESIFGPSATVQGAQARALKTAVNDFGNEGMALVDQHRDKDPAAFHKLLATEVGKHLTGDSITDTLITQQSTEKVTEIAAVQYKAHAKYTQELNLTAGKKAIDSQLASYNIYNALPKDEQSAEGKAKALEAVRTALLDSTGMDPVAHQAMAFQTAIASARQGDKTLLELVMDNFISPTNDQDTKSYEAGKKLTQDKTDAAVYALKQGKTPAPIDYGKFKPSPKDKFDIYEAVKVANVINEHKFDLEAAETEASMYAGIKAGATTEENLVTQLIKAHATFPSTFTTEKMASMLKLLTDEKAKGNEDAKLLQAYNGPNRVLDVADQDKALRLQKAAINNRYKNDPKGAEKAIWDNWAASQYGADKDVANDWHDGFASPFDAGGKPNAHFNRSWDQYMYASTLNRDRADEQVSDPVVRARLMNARTMIELGKMDANGAKAQWRNATELDAKEITRNPVELKKLQALVADETKGNLTRFVPLMRTGGKVYNTGEVQHRIEQYAEAIYQYNGTNAQASFEAAGIEYKKNFETVAGRSIQNNRGRPIAEAMGLSEHGHTAEDAVAHLMKKQNMPYANARVINGMLVLSPSDENHIANGKRSLEIPLTQVGSIYNKEVIKPARSKYDTALGRSSDQNLQRRIDARIKYTLDFKGMRITQQQAVDMLNKEDREQQETTKALWKDIGSVAKKLPIASKIADVVTGLQTREIDKPKVKKFFNGVVDSSKKQWKELLGLD